MMNSNSPHIHSESQSQLLQSGSTGLTTLSLATSGESESESDSNITIGTTTIVPILLTSPSLLITNNNNNADIAIELLSTGSSNKSMQFKSPPATAAADASSILSLNNIDIINTDNEIVQPITEFIGPIDDSNESIDADNTINEQQLFPINTDIDTDTDMKQQQI